ncbi:MAG: NfeD family protein [Ghiorsea sp.]|nr:NfeD family protein [Ghiorsea sp.]MDQ7057120.1 NfeD family protein [Ghiorsea sp.]
MEMIEHWHIWLIIAFIILIIELMSGTYFLLALAGGAALTSIATWWSDPSLTAQLFIFAAASAATYMLLLSFRKKKDDTNTDGTTHMLGQQVQVVDAINTQGRVKYKGVLWQAKSEDSIEKGSFAEIIAVDGSTLTVKALKE